MNDDTNYLKRIAIALETLVNILEKNDEKNPLKNENPLENDSIQEEINHNRSEGNIVNENNITDESSIKTNNKYPNKSEFNKRNDLNIEKYDSAKNMMTIGDKLINDGVFSDSTSDNFYINQDIQKLLLETNNLETNSYFPVLEDFFKKRKITIKRVIQERNYGEIKYILSKFLGNNYDHISVFLKKLKASIFSGGRISMSLRGFPQKKVADICQWANSLYQNAFLTEYKYRNAPQFYLTAEVSLDGEVQNFFTGDWLELYAILCIKNVIDNFIVKNKLRLDYQIFSNVLIQLENEDEFELDIILIINKKLFYWIECKSGQYQDYVHKYSNFAKKYDFEKDKSFVILTDVYPAIEKHLTQLYDINFCSIERFKDIFNESLYKEIILS